MKKALKALQNQSPFSLPPVLHADLKRYKKTLEDCIEERCPDDELADAYESIGLSELFLGNYTEAAHHLECSLIVHKDIPTNDINIEHKMRLNFWVKICYRSAVLNSLPLALNMIKNDNS